MDFAINKSTDEIVSAFEVHKNGSYQNIKKGEWIMPQDSVSNFKELNDEDKYVHYVKEKEYRNKWGTYVWCSSYFAKYPNSNAETISEGKEHKAIKNWLFTKLKKDDLKLVYSKGSKKYKFDNYVKLSELNIDWNKYSVEVSTKGYKTLRADILLQFKNKHEFLGNGIFIEIQLSNQSKKETYERSFSRAIHGYSTVWLFRDEFDSDGDEEFQLKENVVKVFSFSSELKYSGKSFVKNLKIVVEDQCRYLDNKRMESNLSMELKASDIIERFENKEKELFDKLNNLENNPFREIINKYKEELENKCYETLKEVEESKKNNHPDCIGLCNNCKSGYLMRKRGKFGIFYGCSNYPACRSIVSFDNGED